MAPLALGIRGTSDSINRDLKMVVGEKYEFYYTITNNQDSPKKYSISFGDHISYSLEEMKSGEKKGGTDLMKYFSAEPLEIPHINTGESREIKVTVDFFEESEDYGLHDIALKVIEGSPESGGIAVSAGLDFIFHVRVLYPGLRADSSLKAWDTGENGTQMTDVRITNNGKELVTDAYADVRYYDSNMNQIYSTKTEKVTLDSFEGHLWKVEFPMTDFKPGQYHVKAEVHYNGRQNVHEDSYLVGTKQISIVDYTPVLEQDKINNFAAEIENMWNEKVRNVWAEISFNGQTIKSTATNLDAFGKSEVTAFIDGHGLELGEYPIKIRAYFDDKTAEKEGSIEVIKKVYEGPILMKYMTATNLMLLVLIIIMIVFLVMKIRDHKVPHPPKKEKSKEAKKEGQNKEVPKQKVDKPKKP